MGIGVGTGIWKTSGVAGVARPASIAGAALLAAVTAAGAGQPHDLIPAPRELAWGPGELVLGPSTRLAVAGRCDARVERALGRAAARLSSAGGPGVAVAPRDTRSA